MATSSVGSIKKHFRKLRDPRVRGRTQHLLMDIIVMALCGVIANCDGWRDIALFAQKRQDWFKRFLKLPKGVPAHDTFERVFNQLNPQAFGACFASWVAEISELVGLRHIAIDGKALRHSYNRGAGLGMLHAVSAWATEQHLILGQVMTEAKSNEITAIPKLLELLDLHGTLVTIDAMGCQKAIAKQIVAQGGDYILTVKENQEHLLDDIQQSLADACENDFAEVKHDTYKTRERGHGREEYRSYTVLHLTSGLRNAAAWAGVTTIGMCYSERTINGVTSEEARYFIGSKKMSARKYGTMLRGHWGIENNLHWQLDVSFGEDRSGIYRRNAGENFAAMRRIALSLLKRHPSKESIGRKRKAAALDCEFLAEILTGCNQEGKV
jgi:predicted transposase YbfD/YdcC